MPVMLGIATVLALVLSVVFAVGGAGAAREPLRAGKAYGATGHNGIPT